MLLGFITGGVACLFVTVRVAAAAHGNVAAFIVVGATHADRAALPHGVPVFRGTGYDGEFYYRLALDPFAWGHQAFGITLDQPYRITRIAYPALAWLVAGGQSDAVPVALVVVNVVALSAVAGLACSLAREAGRRVAWGLVIAAYWGFLWTMARDLTELVTIAGILGALLALRRGRPVLAGLALSLGALGRETAMLFVAVIALTRVVGWVRFAWGRRASAAAPVVGDLTRSGPGLDDASWLLPSATFAAWQLLVAARTGSIPILSSGASNAGLPLVGLVDGLRYRVSLLPSAVSILWCVEFVALFTVVVCAGLVFFSTRALLHERIAWVAYTLFSLSLSSQVWMGRVGFRSLDEWFLFSWVLLLFSPVRMRAAMRVPMLVVAGTWSLVFLQLVLHI